MKPIINISDLKYKDFLRYPEIQIPYRKLTFLSGESGCGKSTLFKLLNSTLNPSGGIIEYSGQNTVDIDTIQLRKEVLLVSQDVFLFEGTILENFEQYYRFRDMKCIDENEMKKFLSLCCADFSLNSKCQVMSGGERQRIFIAICLSFMPKLIMLDEPTAALDDNTSNKFFSHIKEFCISNNITMLVICHNEKLRDIYGDNHIILEKKVNP